MKRDVLTNVLDGTDVQAAAAIEYMNDGGVQAASQAMQQQLAHDDRLGADLAITSWMEAVERLSFV